MTSVYIHIQMLFKIGTKIAFFCVYEHRHGKVKLRIAALEAEWSFIGIWTVFLWKYVTLVEKVHFSCCD